MIRLSVLALLAMLALGMAGACLDGEEVAEPVVVTHHRFAPALEAPAPLAAEGVQLITEEYLRRQVDIAVAHHWGYIVADLLGGFYNADGRLYGKQASPQLHYVRAAPDWDKSRKVTFAFHYELDGRAFIGPFAEGESFIHFYFEGPNYDAGAGSVTVSNCVQLPGAGVATTGEFTTVTNGSDSDIVHQIDKTVTEASSSSTTLSESLELANSTTIEAGVDFGAGSGSVSDTLSETFGVSKESTADHSSETSVTVSDTITVSPGRVVAIAFSTDDAAQDCTVTIDATADWSKPRIVLDLRWSDNDPRRLLSNYEQIAGPHKKCDIIDGPALGHLVQTPHHGKQYQGGGSITLTEADDLVRLARGTSTHCEPSVSFALSHQGTGAVAAMEDEATRHISFSGKRHSTSEKDASYKAIDVTGQDPTCVAGKLSTGRVLISSLDSDNDGVLDACKP